MHFLSHFPESSRGILVVPTLILYSMPSWFAGVALLGIFIGGLVPAAIMAMSQANLLTRNIIKEFRPNISASSEIRITKISSTAFKFIALGFVFIIPATYAISLQLLGGILITQILPAVFFGLYIKSLRKEPLIASRDILRGVYGRIYKPLGSTNLISYQYSNFWFIVCCGSCPRIQSDNIIWWNCYYE